jgi:hypothetical protein
LGTVGKKLRSELRILNPLRDDPLIKPLDHLSTDLSLWLHNSKIKPEKRYFKA